MSQQDHRETTTQRRPNEPRIHVLHVDDDEAYSGLVQRRFERTHDDVDVTTEVDPTRVLSRLEHGTAVDAVVCDYRMPGITGVELLEQVRGRWPTLPFVMLTGEGSESIAMEAIHAGVTDYFRKDEAGERLALLIERVRAVVLERRAAVESQRFGTLLEMLDVPVAVFDSEGRIRAANQHVDELFPTSAGGDRMERIQDIVADDEQLGVRVGHDHPVHRVVGIRQPLVVGVVPERAVVVQQVQGVGVVHQAGELPNPLRFFVL